MSENPYEDLLPPTGDGKGTSPKKSKAGEEPSSEELYLAQRDLERELEKEREGELHRLTSQERAEEAGILEFSAEQGEREKEKRKNHEEFERIKKEFDENEKKIAEARYKAKSRWQVLKETLGIGGKMVEDDVVRDCLGKRRELWQKLMESGKSTLLGKDGEYQDFMMEYDREAIAIKSRVLETDIRAQNAKWPAKALSGFMRLSGIYRNFISKQFLNEKEKLSLKGIAKGGVIAASISIALATALGVALPAIGVAAMGAGTTSAWIMRVIGGVGAGYVAKKRMEAGFLELKKKEIQERVMRKIEELKNKTDEDWKKMIEGMQLEMSIEGKEQEFADVDARHKKIALVIGSGTIVASALASHFVAPHVKGFLGEAWDKVFRGGTRPSGILPAETTPGRFSGAGLEHTGHGEFSGDFARIEKGGNIWKSTREIFMKYPDEYEYSDDQAKRLFKSFKEQGILKRLGIRGAANFEDLTLGQKHKIWAEWRTAKAVNEYKLTHGGKITDLVHPGDSVRLDEYGKLFIGEASGIKAGYLSDVQRPRGIMTYEPGGKGAVDTSQFDRQIEAARARGTAADARLREIQGPMTQRLAAEAAEIQAVDNLRTQRLMDFIQSKIYGLGTGVDWKEPAREFRKRILEAFITSDQPMGPPANVYEQQQHWKAAQEITRKLGETIGNESTEEWVRRGLEAKKISPEEIIGVFSKVANE